MKKKPTHFEEVSEMLKDRKAKLQLSQYIKAKYKQKSVRFIS